MDWLKRIGTAVVDRFSHTDQEGDVAIQLAQETIRQAAATSSPAKPQAQETNPSSSQHKEVQTTTSSQTAAAPAAPLTILAIRVTRVVNAHFFVEPRKFSPQLQRPLIRSFLDNLDLFFSTIIQPNRHSQGEIYSHLKRVTGIFDSLLGGMKPEEVLSEIANYNRGIQELKKFFANREPKDVKRFLDYLHEQTSQADRKRSLTEFEVDDAFLVEFDRLEKMRHVLENFATEFPELDPQEAIRKFLGKHNQLIVDLFQYQNILEGKESSTREELSGLRCRIAKGVYFVSLSALKQMQTQDVVQNVLSAIDKACHDSAAAVQKSAAAFIQDQINKPPEGSDCDIPPILKRGPSYAFHHMPHGTGANRLEELRNIFITPQAAISPETLVPIDALHEAVSRPTTRQKLLSALDGSLASVRKLLNGRSPGEYHEQVLANEQQIAELEEGIANESIDFDSPDLPTHLIGKNPALLDAVNRLLLLRKEHEHLLGHLSALFPFSDPSDIWKNISALGVFYDLVSRYRTLMDATTTLPISKADLFRLKEDLIQTTARLDIKSIYAVFAKIPTGNEGLADRLYSWGKTKAEEAVQKMMDLLPLSSKVDTEIIDIDAPLIEVMEEGHLLDRRPDVSIGQLLNLLWRAKKEGASDEKKKWAKWALELAVKKFLLEHSGKDPTADEKTLKTVNSVLHGLVDQIYDMHSEGALPEWIHERLQQLHGTMLDFNDLFTTPLISITGSEEPEKPDSLEKTLRQNLQKLKELSAPPVNKTPPSAADLLGGLQVAGDLFVLKLVTQYLSGRPADTDPIGNLHKVLSNSTLDTGTVVTKFVKELRESIRTNQHIGWLRRKIISALIPFLFGVIHLILGVVFDSLRKAFHEDTENGGDENKKIEDRKSFFLAFFNRFIFSMKDILHQCPVNRSLTEYFDEVAGQVEKPQRSAPHILPFMSTADLDASMVRHFLQDYSVRVTIRSIFDVPISHYKSLGENSKLFKFLYYALSSLKVIFWEYSIGWVIETGLNWLLYKTLDRALHETNISATLIQNTIKRMTNQGYSQAGNALQEKIEHMLKTVQEELDDPKPGMEYKSETLATTKSALQELASVVRDYERKSAGREPPPPLPLGLDSLNEEFNVKLHETLGETVDQALGILFKGEKFTTTLTDIYSDALRSIIDMDKPIEPATKSKNLLTKWINNIFYAHEQVTWTDTMRLGAMQEHLEALKKEWQKAGLNDKDFPKEFRAIKQSTSLDKIRERADIVAAKEGVARQVYASRVIRNLLDKIISTVVNRALREKFSPQRKNNAIDAQVKTLKRDLDPSSPASLVHRQIVSKKIRHLYFRAKIILAQKTPVQPEQIRNLKVKIWRINKQIHTSQRIEQYIAAARLSLESLEQNASVDKTSLEQHKFQTNLLLNKLAMLGKARAHPMARDFENFEAALTTGNLRALLTEFVTKLQPLLEHEKAIGAAGSSEGDGGAGVSAASGSSAPQAGSSSEEDIGTRAASRSSSPEVGTSSDFEAEETRNIPALINSVAQAALALRESETHQCNIIAHSWVIDTMANMAALEARRRIEKHIDFFSNAQILRFLISNVELAYLNPQNGTYTNHKK